MKITLKSILILLVIICWSVYWHITAYWYWLVNPDNQTMVGILIAAIVSLISALIGALIGGLIGGAGSYFGGINGAKQNHKLNQETQSAHARKLMIAQLSYSYNRISDIMTLDSSISDTGKPQMVLIQQIIYDSNWPNYLPYLKDVEDDEIEMIVNWFNTINDIVSNQTFGCAIDTVKERIENQLKGIKGIIG